MYTYLYTFSPYTQTHVHICARVCIDAHAWLYAHTVSTCTDTYIDIYTYTCTSKHRYAMQMYACMYPHVHTHTVLSVAVGVLICQTVVVTLRALCYKSCVWTEQKTSHREAPMGRIREALRAVIRTAPPCRICVPLSLHPASLFPSCHVSSCSHERLAACHNPSTPWSRSHPLCRFEVILVFWKAGVLQLSSPLSFLHGCRDLCPSFVSSFNTGKLPTGKGLNI